MLLIITSMPSQIRSKEEILEEYKEEFRKIKQLGFIESNRFHNTGIGKTFEDFIGVIENNKSKVDYKGAFELKSARELSEAMVTLFTKSPLPRGINNIIRKTFGYYDEEYKDHLILHTTFSGNKFNICKDKTGFKLDIDSKNSQINIKIKNLANDTMDNRVKAYYPFKKLEYIIENKCKYIIFISAESKKENGKELFRFNKSTMLSGLTFNKFLKFIGKGIIKYDFRIGVYRTGKHKGKKHDHGSGFRILKGDLNKVFVITELD